MKDSTDDLFEHAPCGLLLTTADDIITRVNATFLEWTGYRRRDVIGRDFHGLLDPGSQAFYGTRYQADLWGREEMKEVAFQLVRADGSQMPILANARLVTSAVGERDGVRLAIFDSTARHDYERQMLEAKRQAETSEASLRVLQDASALFLGAMDETELADALGATARDAFAASDVAVVLYEQGDYRAVHGEHLMPMLTALQAELPEKSAEVFHASMSTVSSLDDAYRLSTRAGDLLRASRAEAFTAVPIRAGDTVLGVLVCLFGRPRTFDQRSTDLHNALARQAGLVLSRVQLQAALERQAMHDHLTGLANRNLLDERVSHALAMARRGHEPVALIFTDLDGFKRINDDLGHRVGDGVLQTIARRMSGVVRDIDLVGRFGGDEFLVVCENTDGAAALLVSERLCAEISKPIEGLPAGYSVTASVGIAVSSSENEESGDSLILRADAAMYESKRSGGDRSTLAGPRALPLMDRPA
jgi:diguanylate cyclase (GGDEF)-like protein/PAS domain S-box-containing protein